MRPALRQIGLLAASVAFAAAALPCAAATAATAATETVAPLPESDYTVQDACASARPGHAGCLAQQLIPVTREAKRRRHPIGMLRSLPPGRAVARSLNSGVFGLRPKDIHTAYKLPVSAPDTQTIALVDAYNDLTAEEDLRKYGEEFGLPECTKANSCFRKVGQTGSETALPFPRTTKELKEFKESGNAEKREEAREAIGWGVEISLDIESAHATCQSCRILLVEAGEPAGWTPFGPTEYSNLVAAEDQAGALGANEISNSWAGSESGVVEDTGFDKPGTVITAASGDDGYRNWELGGTPHTGFPASSPHVVAVGGTRLLLGVEGDRLNELVWNGRGASGGGCSTKFAAPEWQEQVADRSLLGCSTRLDNDVAADADPYSGLVIRDTDSAGSECEASYTEEVGGKEVEKTEAGWCTYGGTSLASPIIAAVFALAGGSHGVAYPARTLYENLREAPGELHDVTEGSNGKCEFGPDELGFRPCKASEEAAASCSSTLACLAGPGYDGPSGVGTPEGILGFQPSPETAPAPQATPPASTATVAAQPQPAPAPQSTAPQTPRLTELGLTTLSVIALDEGSPTTRQVGFSFSLNVAARVRVALARQVRSHGRLRWVTVGSSSTISAYAGHNGGHLTGRRHLEPGLYRLTLTPVKGKARSVLFRIY
ncbi:MAG: S8 family serine peptidase [Solirubrobacteraceae bacterium]